MKNWFKKRKDLFGATWLEHTLFAVICVLIMFSPLLIFLLRHQLPYQHIQTPEKILIKPIETTQMIATGYALGFPYNSITKHGQPVMSKGFLRIGDVEVFTVSADPNIFPLGSVIYIDSLGIGLIHDTGSRIVGRRLDICFQTQELAMQFGKREVSIILLSKGGK